MPNRNTLWASLIVEELVRLGCRVFFIAPGARSTPLTVAAARNPEVKTVIHFDERGTAFAAIGYARSGGVPAVWVTTSGTALANGMPAVIEAGTDGIPMILLTADRPPELRNTGANQTIDQADFFGRHVRLHCDLPTPTDDIAPSYVLTTVDQAVFRSQSPLPGPVHLNCMFRKPLEPVSPPGNESNKWISTLVAEYRNERGHIHGRADPLLLAWASGTEPFTRYSACAPAERAGGVIAGLLAVSNRPLIVAGRIGSSRVSDSLLDWAQKYSVPVLCDVLSQSRFHSASTAAIPYHDLLLSDSRIRDELRPDLVIQVGRLPVSQRLTSWMASSSPDHFAVLAPGFGRQDPSHRVTHRIVCTEEETAAIFSGIPITASPETGWLARWSRENGRIDGWLEKRFGARAEPELSEQGAAYLLSREFKSGDLLMLGSSMSIRHMNTFASGRGSRIRCFANRGVSGIDGTLATAAGILAHEESPMTVLLGDLALLHDLNSMALLRKTDTIIVVLNNDGGGIFSYLPIADQNDVFDPYFSTPHGFSFEGAAAQFGFEYRKCATPDSFADAYRNLRGSGEGGLIEVRTDRERSRMLNRQLMEESRNE